MKKIYILVLVVFSFLDPLFTFCGTPTKENIPLCEEPQNIAPAQNFGLLVLITMLQLSGMERILPVWLFQIRMEISDFRRFFADGTPASEPIPIFQVASNNGFCNLVWNGNGYGVVYTTNTGTYYVVKFHLLSTEGLPVGNEVQVSFVGETPTSDLLRSQNYFWKWPLCDHLVG